jgi:FMN phosphatase YigB (HAD superfamily)
MLDRVFLFDVDNTLLDNDHLQDELRAHLAESYGQDARDRYWAIFQELFKDLGYADYLGALERYRLERLHDPKLLLMATWLVDYPFRERLYPGALAAVAHARTLGPISILSDGDAVFQPVKIARSGLRAAFEDEVLIYIHKEQELADIEHWRPARHYVMIDDKPRILGAMKKAWGDRVTTVWVRQGHYAAEAGAWDGWPPPDRDIAAIGDFAGLDFPAP